MKQGLIFTLFFIFVSWTTIAEEKRSISGSIKDGKGTPVLGVNVLVEGTENGTTSDFDGLYEINNLEEGTTYTIVFSSIGFKTLKEKIVVKGDVIKDITIQEDLQSLDEIVLTGTSNPRTKLESSVAIKTMGAIELEKERHKAQEIYYNLYQDLW